MKTVDGRPEPRERAFGCFEQTYYKGAARPSDSVDPWVLDHLLEVLSSKSFSILSLDVFDTLLLRNGKAEIRRFWEIAERWRVVLESTGSAQFSVDELFAARLRAAEICYSFGPLIVGTQEGRLDNIVEIVLALVNAPQAAAGALILRELEYEAENTAPNPVVLDLIAAHKSAGGKVILLSDMYMRACEITALLAHHGLGAVADTTFSSADLTVNKRTGTVFNEVSGRLGVDGSEILHIGDSFVSDFSMPRFMGWSAQHLPVPLEEELIREADRQDFEQALKRG